MSKEENFKLIIKTSDKYNFDSFFNVYALKKHVDDFIVETRRDKMDREKMKTLLVEISAISLSYISTTEKVE